MSACGSQPDRFVSGQKREINEEKPDHCGIRLFVGMQLSEVAYRKIKTKNIKLPIENIGKWCYSIPINRWKEAQKMFKQTNWKKNNFMCCRMRNSRAVLRRGRSVIQLCALNECRRILL